MTPEELHTRRLENLRLSRALAGRLAASALVTANLLERRALFHETVAADVAHPLSSRAAERAERERRLAEQERAASTWFRHIADRVDDGRVPAT